jgi:hypothetical protein
MAAHDPGEATLHAQPAFNMRNFSQVLDAEPERVATHDRAMAAPRERRPFPWMVVAALGAAFLAVVSVAGAVVFWWRSAPSDDVVVEAAATGEETTGAAAGPSGGGSAPVEIAFGVPVQWARLESGGATVVQAKGALKGTVAAGNYTLIVKRVGRPALKANVEVAAAGVQAQCDERAEGMDCTGDVALRLRP